MSARPVSPTIFHGLLTLLYLLQVFAIRQVFPIPYNTVSPYLNMQDTCWLGMCHRYLYLIFMTSSFHDWVSFIRFATNIDNGGYDYVSQVCVIWPWPYFHGLLSLLNLRQVFKISFSIMILHELIIFGPHIDDGGYISVCVRISP